MQNEKKKAWAPFIETMEKTQIFAKPYDQVPCGGVLLSGGAPQFLERPRTAGPQNHKTISRHPAAGGPRTLQLVPIFDMCNHRPAAAAADASRRVVEVTSDGVAVLTAPEALRAGDEIAFPYDAGGGNAELLLDYGFGIGADGAAATAAPPEDPEAVAAVLE